MAKDPKKTGTGVAKLQRWGEAMTQAHKRFRRIHVAAVETGAGVLLDGRRLSQAFAWDKELFAAYKAQRTRLAGAKLPTTLDGMLDKEHAGDLRALLLANYAKHRKMSEVELHVPLAPEDKAIPAFAAFLNDATKLLVQAEYLGEGKPNIPKFIAIGIGEDSMSLPGHCPDLEAKKAARSAA